jgi:hypothetical protein
VSRTLPLFRDGEPPATLKLDGARIASLLERVKAHMLSGAWYTLDELASLVGGSEAGISARIRDLRKPQFGGYNIQRRRRAMGPAKGGLHEYRLRRP